MPVFTISIEHSTGSCEPEQEKETKGNQIVEKENYVCRWQNLVSLRFRKPQRLHKKDC